MYCLFCVVLCIICVYMCTELLPLGGYPIAVKYIISYISYITYHIPYIISYHIIYIISYHIIYHVISYNIYHITSHVWAWLRISVAFKPDALWTESCVESRKELTNSNFPAWKQTVGRLVSSSAVPEST
jgi:hypothetical protein